MGKYYCSEYPEEGHIEAADRDEAESILRCDDCRNEGNECDGLGVVMSALDGPFNEKWCNNPKEPEVCRHYRPDYLCSKHGAELAMGCVDPTPEKFWPVAIRCAKCLAGGAE